MFTVPKVTGFEMGRFTTHRTGLLWWEVVNILWPCQGLKLVLSQIGDQANSFYPSPYIQLIVFNFAATALLKSDNDLRRSQCQTNFWAAYLLYFEIKYSGLFKLVTRLATSHQTTLFMSILPWNLFMTLATGRVLHIFSIK